MIRRTISNFLNKRVARKHAAAMAEYQAGLDALAQQAAERFFAEWEKKSLDECIQACGFESEAEARQAARFILGDA